MQTGKLSAELRSAEDSESGNKDSRARDRSRYISKYIKEEIKKRQINLIPLTKFFKNSPSQRILNF